jgi:hypothetical protein
MSYSPDAERFNSPRWKANSTLRETRIAPAPPCICQDIEIYVVWLGPLEARQIGSEQRGSCMFLSPSLTQRICNRAVLVMSDTKDGGFE